MVRDGTYYLRICVPKDVVAEYGRSLIVRSLRTKDLRRAKAQLPYLIVAAEAEFYAIHQARQCAACPSGSDGSGAVAAVADLSFTPPAQATEWSATAGKRSAIVPKALIFSRQWSAPQLEIVSLNTLAPRQPSSPEDEINNDNATIPDMEPSKAALSIDRLFSLWERETKPSASTLSSWRGHKRHFQAYFGPKAEDLASILAGDIVAWKNRLIEEQKSVATISRSYLGFAQALFRFAISNKLLKANPADGVKHAGKAKPGTKMLPYSNAEVARLLSHATAAETPWKRWLPWLAAATGSRIGEMAQLHVSHIDAENGIPIIRITPAPDAGTIKNTGSERTVPIHRALIEGGFLIFVNERGSGPLFYDRTSGDAKKMQRRSTRRRALPTGLPNGYASSASTIHEKRPTTH
ncbi:MAG: Site-specific recombinase XerC [Rhizobium sp.]|nr:Site-specific recombinase XerC [Rhizobium sp.]